MAASAPPLPGCRQRQHHRRRWRGATSSDMAPDGLRTTWPYGRESIPTCARPATQRPQVEVQCPASSLCTNNAKQTGFWEVLSIANWWAAKMWMAEEATLSWQPTAVQI
eukprot:2099248-Amphidinium_carterae.1